MSCVVDVAFTVTVPPPLSLVPGLLLSTTASLVAKLTMQTLLPQFLELLAVDYQRWSSGTVSRAQPAGSLVPITATAAEPAGDAAEAASGPEAGQAAAEGAVAQAGGAAEGGPAQAAEGPAAAQA
jgi:hypothetical protein